MKNYSNLHIIFFTYKPLLFLLFLMINVQSCYFKGSEPYLKDQAVSDCPYISYKKAKVIVNWVEHGTLFEQIYTDNSFNKLKIKSCKAFKSKYLKINPKQIIDYQQKFVNVSKIIAVSDIHGQHDLFLELLKANKVINKKGNWRFGKGHFVLVGDVFDRGDKVTETLWFLYKLEQQAAKVGGKVHFLLGNHEVMVLNGNLKYINKKYESVSEIMKMPFEDLFSSNTLLGRWLRSKPIAITINDIAFTHGGFSPEYVKKKFNIALINQLFKEDIIDNNIKNILSDETLKFMAKSKGPIWYRGYFRDKDFTEEKAKKILDYIQVKHIVVGHTSMKNVLSHYNGLIYSVDSSIKKGETGEVLIWENNMFFRGDLRGKRVRI